MVDVYIVSTLEQSPKYKVGQIEPDICGQLQQAKVDCKLAVAWSFQLVSQRQLVYLIGRKEFQKAFPEVLKHVGRIQGCKIGGSPNEKL